MLGNARAHESFLQALLQALLIISQNLWLEIWAMGEKLGEKSKRSILEFDKQILTNGNE